MHYYVVTPTAASAVLDWLMFIALMYVFFQTWAWETQQWKLQRSLLRREEIRLRLQEEKESMETEVDPVALEIKEETEAEVLHAA